MTLPLILRPEAEADLKEARDWYEQQSHGLGIAFLDEVEMMLYRIQSMPKGYPALLREVRRGKLHRFPYLVYYRVLADRIEILGVLHGSRNPQVWQDRA